MATDVVHMVTLGSDAGELRRRLGPTSWAVLEELLQRSNDGEARVSIRTLAKSLGLAKDTVARSVRRLRAAGLIVAHQTRNEAGTFDTGVYRVTVDPDCLTVETTTRRMAPTANTRSSRHQSEQLALTLDP